MSSFFGLSRDLMVFTVRTAKRSLQENDLTVVSIFVNPAQFAPHEDLSSYLRTPAHDLELLEALRVSIPNHRPSLAPALQCSYHPFLRCTPLESVETVTVREAHSYGGKEQKGFLRGSGNCCYEIVQCHSGELYAPPTMYLLTLYYYRC